MSGPVSALRQGLLVEVRERAERVFMRQKREIKMLSALLCQIDAGVTAILKT